ncbi:PREDICTED: uncharacterized protein LOC104731093 [Camelina sativa]|uniref:Uncharacterized protein LOC104731093 n=1 Tax=Camelina sativa TaxID=90675 RepID=A0ABM0UZQ8_CAMSA|nr:PREDICTED: uncharacterized protein LOC104731093 [Camelina sativa]
MSSRLFPEPTTTRDYCRDTIVIWEWEDYATPEKLNPRSIKKKVRSALKKDGYKIGDLSIWVYAPENTWLIDGQSKDKFYHAGLVVSPLKGDKRTRLHRLLAEAMVSSFIWTAEDTNVLILSENVEYLKQDPRFSSFHEELISQGFPVALAHPDDVLLNQEDEPDSEYDEEEETASDCEDECACLEGCPCSSTTACKSPQSI